MLQLKLIRAVIFIGLISFCAAQEDVTTTTTAPVVKIKCLQCDSSDANCISNLSQIKTVDCEAKCFTKVDTTNGKISRDCNTQNEKCDAPNCYECSDNECNKHNICKSCNKEADCSKTDSTKDAFNSVCATEQTQCIKKITDLYVERRCAKPEETAENCNNDTCKLCTGANCNTGIFPDNRIKCYQCIESNSKCINVENTDSGIVSDYCLLYKPDDACYTHATSETAMSRGCVSDADTAVNKCSIATNAACATCSSSSCNSRAYEYNQTFKCLQCNDKDKCRWAQKVEDAKDCTNKIKYTEDGGCYTQNLEDNTVVRGCIHDRTEVQGECKDTCKTCTTDGCNNADSGDFTCIKCRSNEKDECRRDAKKIPGVPCDNKVGETDAACFVGWWNNVVIRGCLVDADPRQQLECNGPEFDNCEVCKTADCNTKANAVTLKITSSLFLGILVIFWRLH